MKKSVIVILACLLLLSLVFTSCDPSDGTGANTTAPQNVTPETPKVEPTPEKTVESVNGKNALELYKATKQTLSSLTSYEITSTEVKTEEGKTVTSQGTIKMSGNNVYMYISMDGSITEMTAIGRTLYMRVDDQKVVMQDTALSDLMDEDLTDLTASGFFSFPDSKFSDIKIKNKDTSYYFTVSFTAEEASEIGLTTEESGKITFYYNAEGALTKTQCVQATSNETTVIVSLNKAIVIAAPADADAYIDYDDVLGGGGNDNPQPPAPNPNVDQAVLNTYMEVAEWAESQQVLMIEYYDSEDTSLLYYCDSQGDKSVMANQIQEIYCVNDVYYVGVDGSYVQAPESEELVNALTSAEILKTMPSMILSTAQSVGIESAEIESKTGDYNYKKITITCTDGEIITLSFDIGNEPYVEHGLLLEVSSDQQTDVTLWITVLPDGEFDVVSPLNAG